MGKNSTNLWLRTPSYTKRRSVVGFYRLVKVIIGVHIYNKYVGGKINLNQIRIYVQHYTPRIILTTVQQRSSTSKPISLNDHWNTS